MRGVVRRDGRWVVDIAHVAPGGARVRPAARVCCCCVRRRARSWTVGPPGLPCSRALRDAGRSQTLVAGSRCPCTRGAIGSAARGTWAVWLRLSGTSSCCLVVAVAAGDINDHRGGRVLLRRRHPGWHRQQPAPGTRGVPPACPRPPPPPRCARACRLPAASQHLMPLAPLARRCCLALAGRVRLDAAQLSERAHARQAGSNARAHGRTVGHGGRRFVRVGVSACVRASTHVRLAHMYGCTRTHMDTRGCTRRLARLPQPTRGRALRC